MEIQPLLHLSDSLREGGRDPGRFEKPGLQSLRQRNPRFWESAAEAEVAGEGMGTYRLALSKEGRAAVSVSRLGVGLGTLISAP